MKSLRYVVTVGLLMSGVFACEVHASIGIAAGTVLEARPFQVLDHWTESELFDAWVGTEEPQWRELALKELLTRGEAAVQLARSRLAPEASREEAFLAMELLGRLCGVDCAPDLLAAAKDHGDDAVRSAAIRALVVIQAPGAPELVTPFLSEDESPVVIASALSVVGRMGGVRHAPSVEPWLDHSDPTLRLLARFVLARLLAERGETPSPGRAGLAPEIHDGEGPTPSIEGLLFAADFISESRRILEELSGDDLAQEYDVEGKKHLVALSASYGVLTVTLLLDLDDLLGFSEEGQEGWITYWIDVKTGFSISLSIFGPQVPAGLSLLQHDREPGVDDPLRRLEFTDIAFSSGAVEVRAGNVGYGGIEVLTMTDEALSTDILSGSILTTSGTVARGEIRREAIEGVLAGVFQEESGGVSWPRVAEAVILDLVVPVGFVHHFVGLASPSVHRPFTSSDDPPDPGEVDPRAQTLSEVRAGLDADGDHYGDGYVPPSGSGSNPTQLWDLDVFFFPDHTIQKDFRVRVVDVPEGWRIVARGQDNEAFGDVYDVFNAVPAPQSPYGTEWYIGCTPSAAQTVAVDFELLERDVFSFDDLLDTVTAAFTCQTPPAQPSPATGFVLTVEKVGGSADGTITSDPAVLSCLAECTKTSASVSAGTEIELTATASTGTVFSGWGGACSGSGTCTVTMNDNLVVAASLNPASVATTPPAAPSGLQANAVSTSAIELSWSDSSSSEDGFKIERRNGGTGPWFQIKRLGPGVTSFTNVSLLPDTTYAYRVYAYNEGGPSGFSGAASSTTFSDAPHKPTGVRAWPLSNSQVAVAWDDPNHGSAAYEIEQSADGSSWAVVGYNGTGDTTFTRTVNPESTRHFRVRAFRSGSGYSGYSSTVTVTACAAPDEPRLEDPYSGEDDVPLDRVLEWDGDDEVASWDVYLGVTDPPPAAATNLPNLSPGDDVTFDPGDLEPGKTYYWGVVAHAACNPSLTSASAIEFFSTLGAPDPVVLLKPADGSEEQPTGLVFDWANVAGDGSVVYDLYLGTTDPPEFYKAMHTRTEELIEGLTAGTTYYWKVLAMSAEDPSLTSTSPVWQFTTGSATTTTVHLAATQDAGLRGGAFGNRNYGGDPTGEAEQKAFGTGNDDNFYLDPGSAALRGAVKFDLSSIPAGSTVLNATLTLQWAGSDGSHSAPLAMYFAPYTASWSEVSITWNNRPSVNTAHQVEGTFPLSGFNPTQNDLTVLAQKWVDGTIANQGLEVSIPEWESETNKAKYFYQKEWSPSLAADLQVTYGDPCSAPDAPASPSPASGATDQASPLTLDWEDVSGVSSYDVYFGTSPSPDFHSLSASSSLEVNGLSPATTYHWRVESRAACDTSLTTTSPTWSFTTDSCLDPAAPTPVSPAHQAEGQPKNVTLTWDAVAGAGEYEVYLGTTNPPTSLLTTTSGTTAAATVQADTRYFWQVRGIAACDPSRSATSVIQLFDTAAGPNADAGPDQVVPEGTTGVLGATPPASGGVAPYTYSWTITPAAGASLSSATEPNPTLTADEPGNYVVQLVVMDSNQFTSLPAQALIEVPCSNENVVLAGETIVGPVQFEACRTLTIGTSVVESSGDLTLRAGEKVILGDGFRVDAGGRLTVVVDPDLDL